MASVNETVKRMIAAYPGIHQTRAQALHYLFCVAGNGYRWKKGELVPGIGNSDPFTPWTRSRAEDQMLDTVSGVDSMPSFVKESLRASFEPRWDEYEKIVAEAEERAATPSTDLGRKAYPQTPNALLLSVPKNATADWLAAAEEVKVVVRASGWDI